MLCLLLMLMNQSHAQEAQIAALQAQVAALQQAQVQIVAKADNNNGHH